MKAVIHCGGKGARLRPYTTVMPTPLLPVGTRPVLEYLLKWLRHYGIDRAYVTTGHLGHLIRAYLGDGSGLGLKISYTEVPEQLGTAGALSILRDELNDTFLSLNGDILSDLNLEDFVAEHRTRGSVLTVATVRQEVRKAFGIIEAEEGWITGFKEEPIALSARIYCMEPSILDFIPTGIPFGFDQLMDSMVARKLPIRGYMHEGLWFDIGGDREDFRKAQAIEWDDVFPDRGGDASSVGRSNFNERTRDNSRDRIFNGPAGGASEVQGDHLAILSHDSGVLVDNKPEVLRYHSALPPASPGTPEEAFNRAADDLLAVAERAAKAAAQRGDEIDANLAQIRILRAEPVLGQEDSSP